jgi:signal transduction histidine kinase
MSGALAGSGLAFWQSWAIGAAAVLLGALLLPPLRLIADRVIFPGGRLGEADLELWRRELGAARGWEDLAARSQALIRRQVRADIGVRLAGATVQAAPSPAPAQPSLVCAEEDGLWRCRMEGWQDAPPGPRHVAQVFGELVAEAASRLRHAEEAVQREGERRRQAHLAELGALAATVAHDLRNPLNIVNMAVASGPPDVRQEVATQLARMDRLIADLLDYAAAWKVEPRSLVALDEVEAAAVGLPGAPIETALAPDLTVVADAGKLRRVLVNLLTNARAAAGVDGRIRVEAERATDSGVAIAVLDNGPGLPQEIRERLFQPFVSRTPQGTGLGLAIVARIMEAHGGSAALVEREGWATCFLLRFPPVREGAAS